MGNGEIKYTKLHIEICGPENESQKFEIGALEKKLKYLKFTLHHQTLFEDSLTQIDLVKKDIEEIVKEKTKGVIIRSRANWVEWGGKTFKYFLNLKKHNYNVRAVNKIRNRSGELVNGRK